MTADPPPAETPADDATLVLDSITNYEEATNKVRELAKWFATSGAALAALLVGTSPLADVASVSGKWLAAAIICAVVALGALGWLVHSTSEVLAPQVVELDEVATGSRYKSFRRAVDASPAGFLGAWPGTVKAFADRRRELYQEDAGLQDHLKNPGLGKAERAAFEDARATVQLSLRRSGWVAQRLLAAAENHRTWNRFTTARRKALIAIGLCALAVGGFLASVQAGKSAGEAATFAGPLPVRVALTDVGRTAWGSILGVDCPTDDFEALLLDGGQSGPWSLMVTDAGCTSGRMVLTTSQGVVLVRSTTG